MCEVSMIYADLPIALWVEIPCSWVLNFQDTFDDSTVEVSCVSTLKCASLPCAPCLCEESRLNICFSLCFPV